jgi:hypothetical protein
MNRNGRCLAAMVVAVGMTGCASARNLPDELPRLPPPPPPKIVAPPVMPVSAELALFDAGGAALPQAIPIEQDFQARLSYKVPQGERFKGPIVVSLLYPMKDKTWAIAWQGHGKSKPDRYGKYTMEVKLRSPPRPGKCLVAASAHNQDFIQVPLEVK